MTQQQRSQNRTRKFSCTQCGQCCRRPGYVEMTGDDIKRLCEHLDVDDIAFFDAYTVEAFGENFAIQVEEGSPCVFLRQDKCSVFEARPEQCRTYPFWPEFISDFDEWQAEGAFCPGIGQGAEYSAEEAELLSKGIGSTKGTNEA